MAHKDSTAPGYQPFQKSYENLDFLHSGSARLIRVLCEMVEPEVRFREKKIRDTIVMFGSARCIPQDKARAKVRELEALLSQKGGTKDLKAKLERARTDVKMSRYYEDAAKLAKRLTLWSKTIADPNRKFFVCSGGGPGIMEAANKGAYDAGGPSIGLNISLPFEQTPNPFQTRDISFEFHYFFIRKFWFFYLAKALVVFPGGFGTMDELFELLTLVQTKKSKKYMPIVIYGTEYWNELIDFKAMARWGVINPEDLNLFRFCDDVDSAYKFLTTELTKIYLSKTTSRAAKSANPPPVT